MKDEWVFWSEVLTPKKFEMERPAGVSETDWKLMKKRFSYRRLSETKRAYDQLSYIVIKSFVDEMRKVGFGYVPSDEDLNISFKIVKTIRSMTPDPEEQFSILISTIRTYINLFPQYGHNQPTIKGYYLTLGRNPAAVALGKETTP